MKANRNNVVRERELMNLVSCTWCCVVMDKTNLAFPDEINKSDGSVDLKKAAWDGENYVPKVSCPVCNQDVLKTQ